MKPCIACGVTKPLTEFYKHKQMADGHLNKCKNCVKVAVRANRRKRVNQYRKYDVERFKCKERRASAAACLKRQRERDPQKAKARNAVSNAVRDGRLKRLPCEVCGNEKSEAHHTDYSKPLDVRWLCRVHHMMEHGAYEELRDSGQDSQ